MRDSALVHYNSCEGWPSATSPKRTCVKPSRHMKADHAMFVSHWLHAFFHFVRQESMDLDDGYCSRQKLTSSAMGHSNRTTGGSSALHPIMTLFCIP